MRELRAHTLKLQRLEQSAAAKAGLRCCLLDEKALFSPRSQAYIAKFVKQLIADVTPEIVAAARLGIDLGKDLQPHAKV